jgi:hypothetical protein
MGRPLQTDRDFLIAAGIDLGARRRVEVCRNIGRQVACGRVRVAERLKKAIEVDPTRAVVDYNKILREEQNEGEPQQYSRHAGRQRRISELERARRPNR